MPLQTEICEVRRKGDCEMGCEMGYEIIFVEETSRTGSLNVKESGPINFLCLRNG